MRPIAELVCLTALFGCGSPAARPPLVTSGARVVGADDGDIPAVRLVVLRDRTAHFVRTGPRGLVETRVTQLAGDPLGLVWVGADPTVLVQPDSPTTPLPPVVGTLAADGFHALTLPPDSTWQVTPAPSDAEHFDAPWWQLVAGDHDSVWVGRCEWGYMEDGGSCVAWRWARVSGGALAVTADEPKHDDGFAFPEIPPSPIAKLERVAYLIPGDGTPRTGHFLRCTVDDKTIEWPAAGERNYMDDVDSIQWVSARPPIYQASVWSAGLDYALRTVTLEGCAPSETWADAALFAGPHDVFAMRSNRALVVRWRGKQVGVWTAPDSDAAFGALAFAP